MKAIKFLLVTLFLAGSAMAQGWRARGIQEAPVPPTDALKEYLKLSDQQLADLKAVQKSMREALKPIVDQLAVKGKALREELKKTPVDTAAVTKLRSDIQALHDQAKPIRANYSKQAVGILAHDQQAALANLEQALSLQAAARQAVGLNLIEPPEGAPGWLAARRLRRGATGPGAFGPERPLRP